MGNVIKLEDFKYPWHEVFSDEGSASTIQVYTNDQTGEVEIVQMNDEGEAIRTTLSPQARMSLVAVLTKKSKKETA